MISKQDVKHIRNICADVIDVNVVYYSLSIFKLSYICTIYQSLTYLVDQKQRSNRQDKIFLHEQIPRLLPVPDHKQDQHHLAGEQLTSQMLLYLSWAMIDMIYYHRFIVPEDK